MDGPIRSRVYCYGERPGATEERAMRRALEEGFELEHYCFIGEAGREFNENYLLLGNLHRDEVRVGNTVQCGKEMNRKPKWEEAWNCAAFHMGKELEEGNPEVVILIGGTACGLLKGEIDLEADHGIPMKGELFDWQGWIVPMYHPAAGLHSTELMIPMLSDWEILGRWLGSGEWQWPIDNSVKDYGLLDTVVETEEFLHRYLSSHWLPVPIGGDTESHLGEPYSWQFSLESNVARMVFLKNREVCKVLSDELRASAFFLDFPSEFFAFHYAQADLDIFERELGFSLDGLYRDTMQETYHLGNVSFSQGLKPVTRRLLGRKRKSWEETVTPYSKAILADWLQEGFIYAEKNWQRVEERFHKKTGKPLKPKIHRSEAEKLIPELMGYMLNNPEYKIWEKIVERMDEKELGMLEVVNGKVPGKGIAHCPLDVQIEYGCSDPDDTRQIALLFDKMREEFIEKLYFQEEDRDG
jgi:uracil-DNA glycosylase family 4